MKLSTGLAPSNLDLFVALDKKIIELESKFPCVIGFWHIRREYNTLADRLARKGAKEAS